MMKHLSRDRAVASWCKWSPTTNLPWLPAGCKHFSTFALRRRRSRCWRFEIGNYINRPWNFRHVRSLQTNWYHTVPCWLHWPSSSQKSWHCWRMSSIWVPSESFFSSFRNVDIVDIFIMVIMVMKCRLRALELSLLTGQHKCAALDILYDEHKWLVIWHSHLPFAVHLKTWHVFPKVAGNASNMAKWRKLDGCALLCQRFQFQNNTFDNPNRT